jgi:HK97 family phage portal protein
LDILKYFRHTKQPIPNRSSTFNYSGLTPPDRNLEGILRAYGEIGWLHAVVFRIALGCSEVKWTLSDASNREHPKQIFKHPVLDLLRLVNPFQTSNEFIALDTIYNELVGESFWALNLNALGEPAEIVLPYPHKMSVVPAKEFPYVKGYVYGTGQDAIPFDVNEIIHFKYPSPLNQYRGQSPAQAIGVELDSEQYSSQWIRQFFFNSARPDGVIQFDYNLSDEQFDKLKKQWSEKYKGVYKAHQVALLEGGGKYLQIQNSVKDMDFPNLKLKNRDSILGVYGMPLSVMGISENVNKANAEAGDYTFARWIVKPRLDWKVAKLQEQLIPKFRRSENLVLGFEEVVPETIEQKRDLAESGMRAGHLTINEARKMQHLDPLPAGDVLLVPLNLIATPIDKIELPPIEETPNTQNVPPDETNNTNDVTPSKSKGLTPDQKKLHWENYAKTTASQELVFKKVFDNVFNEQKNQVIEQLGK